MVIIPCVTLKTLKTLKTYFGNLENPEHLENLENLSWKPCIEEKFSRFSSKVCNVCEWVFKVFRVRQWLRTMDDLNGWQSIAFVSYHALQAIVIFYLEYIVACQAHPVLVFCISFKHCFMFFIYASLKSHT